MGEIVGENGTETETSFRDCYNIEIFMWKLH